MNNSDCRRLADKYRKGARQEHAVAISYFKAKLFEFAIEAEDNATALEKLFKRYEKLGRSR